MPNEGLLERLRKGLKKTKEAIEFGLIFAGRKVDEEFFEELEEKQIRADVGSKSTLYIVEVYENEPLEKAFKRFKRIVEKEGFYVLSLYLKGWRFSLKTL